VRRRDTGVRESEGDVPLIDERGRLFGRVNLIDAVVAMFVLLLIPLAYGAFLLFRVPLPTITSVEPSTMTEHGTGVLTIKGADLRPFLHARLGGYEARYLVQSPTLAEVRLPDLPSGTYDLTLTDEANPLVVKTGAVTIVGPRLEVEAAGAFVGLSKEQTALVTMTSLLQAAGAANAAPPIARLLALGRPEPVSARVKIGENQFAAATTSELRVPAIVRLGCAVIRGECIVGGTAVAKGATLTLPFSSPDRAAGKASLDAVAFAVDQVFPAGVAAALPTIATVRVRFIAVPETLRVIKAGDADISGAATDADHAVLTELGSERQPFVATGNTEGLLRRSFQVPQPMVGFNATLRVPVVFTPSGWTYKDRPVKVGAAFAFETTTGAMLGSILDVQPDPEPRAK
jgi:hypothetical protein